MNKGGYQEGQVEKVLYGLAEGIRIGYELEKFLGFHRL